MGQSLVKNYVHIIFSTKSRTPFIQAPLEPELHAYLGGICKELSSPAISVGGYTDHVHILCRLSKNVALSQLIQKLKSASSKWIKSKSKELSNFYWQNGYGAFSVNPKQVEAVVDYISKQHEHHKQKTFQEEYRAFLNQYKIDFDEQYVWD